MVPQAAITMPISLNKEQSAVLRAVKAGKNVFLTGAGGTGKSHTIRAITEWATAAGIRHAVTAMTGCAALLLNPAVAAATGPSLRTAHAKTLHSWAGVGLAREAPHELAAAVLKNKRAAARWLDTQLLIIDEISMMTPEFLEKLDLVARRVRRRPAVRFGGLQLVLAGDFCQLPPVQRGSSTVTPSIPVITAPAAGAGAGSPSTSSDDEAKSSAPKFVFEMPLWAELVDECHELVQIQRQSDPVFQRLLNEARFGELSEESIDLLTRRMGLPWQENEIRPTLIFSRNVEVNSINEQNMALLDGERHTFTVQTTYKDGHVLKPEGLDIALTRFDADAPYDPEVTLCIGAQVMLLINKDQEAGLVNGSRGVVTAFSDGGLPIVQFKGGPVLIDPAEWWLPDPDYAGIGRRQLPLRVAYAITIHKSQGATLDTALIDIGSRTFEFGQAYVALSRVRSLDGLYIWKLDPRRVRCHPAVKAFYERLRGSAAADPVTTALATAPAEEEGDPVVPEPWNLEGVSSAWRAVLDPYLASAAGLSLRETLIARNQTTQTAPLADDVFAALRACPDPAAVRVVILGQDPYHTPGMAHGLAFSVRPAVTKLPPSLQNIYKELVSDLGVSSPPASGCLTAWAEQGVLLLNDVLTVAIGSPQSHAGIGWELLTAQLLTRVLEAAPHVVVIAWGRPAQKKLLTPAVAARLAAKDHTVLQAPHPSPLSAHTGFFGSRPFSNANAALTAHGLTPIKWI
jgi:ATP-dependent DNA helicase PIF1